MSQGGIERDGRSRPHGGDGKGGTDVGAVPVGGTEREERKARAGVKHETCLLTIFEAIGLGSIVSTGST